MGKEDWYRNETWNAEVEARFRAKLAGARTQGPQCLMIQAGCLAQRHPQVALGLVDDYFGTGDKFFTADAHCVRAAALCSIGNTAEAIVSYKEALAWEASHPNNITRARIDYPKVVATHRIEQEYRNALQVLTDRFRPDDHTLPLIAYEWNGSCALIALEMGLLDDAGEFAERALRAAATTQSPFANHRSVGLVQNTSDDFGRRLKEIAETSKLRLFLRRFFPRKTRR